MFINNLILRSREEGIRTLDTLLTYIHFPGVLLQPLGHLSISNGQSNEFFFYLPNFFHKILLNFSCYTLLILDFELLR